MRQLFWLGRLFSSSLAVDIGDVRDVDLGTDWVGALQAEKR